MTSHQDQKTPSRAGFLSLLFFIFFLYVEDLATLVVTAVWAYRVRQAHLATITALHEVDRLQAVMRAAAISTALR